MIPFIKSNSARIISYICDVIWRINAVPRGGGGLAGSVHLVLGRYLSCSPFRALIVSFYPSSNVLKRVPKLLHGFRFDSCCPTIPCHSHWSSFSFGNPASIPKCQLMCVFPLPSTLFTQFFTWLILQQPSFRYEAFPDSPRLYWEHICP